MSFLLGGVLPPQKCFCGTTRKFVIPFKHAGAKEAHGRRVNALKEPEVESVEEIEGDMENQSTASLYARFDSLLDNTMQDYNLGDSVRGIIATVDDKGAYVDVGGKSPAFIPINEASHFKLENIGQALEVNTERDFHVVYRNRNPKPGRHEIVVSLKQNEIQHMKESTFQHFVNKIGYMHTSVYCIIAKKYVPLFLEEQIYGKRVKKALTYKRFQQLGAEKMTVEGKITGTNSGGLFVVTEGITAFCPGSLVPQDMKEEGMEALVGKTLNFHILEINPDNERLLLSARGQQMMNQGAKAMYKVGDVVLGKVTSVQNYGAFLSIGEGVDGLLHVSQISNDHVDQVSKVLSVGDQLKVMVLTQDMEKGRLSLSTRKLEPTPGDMLRDPSKVFAQAEEMAEAFKKRVAEVEAEYNQADNAAKAEKEDVEAVSN